MTEERQKEILECFDDNLWTPFAEVQYNARQYARVRPPTVHELQAMHRANLLGHRPRGATVGPGVWAATEFGLALKYGNTVEENTTVPAAESRW